MKARRDSWQGHLSRYTLPAGRIRESQTYHRWVEGWSRDTFVIHSIFPSFKHGNRYVWVFCQSSGDNESSSSSAHDDKIIFPRDELIDSTESIRRGAIWMGLASVGYRHNEVNILTDCPNQSENPRYVMGTEMQFQKQKRQTHSDRFLYTTRGLVILTCVCVPPHADCCARGSLLRGAANRRLDEDHTCVRVGKKRRSRKEA